MALKISKVAKNWYSIFRMPQNHTTFAIKQFLVRRKIRKLFLACELRESPCIKLNSDAND